MKQTVDVAAYIWPAFTGDEPRSRIFWPQGNGEWETVQAAVPRFPGHEWPRRPLWGYCNEADPRVMEAQIGAAADHGVNVFIYDWYWYDGRPFLEQCLDRGFLGASNRSRMKFYLMWANHDATCAWDRRLSEVDSRTPVWRGAVSEAEFRKIGMLWLRNYLTLPEYYRIDGKPVVAIYDLQNLIDGLGGIPQAAAAMEWLDGEARKVGLPGIHYQLIKFGTVHLDQTGVDRGGDETLTPAQLARLLPFSSLTHYQFVHITRMGFAYGEILNRCRAECAAIAKEFEIPYYPHVSIGWDNTPRFPHKTGSVCRENTPQAFEAALEEARLLAEQTGAPLVTVNSWNEWTEGSYLEPDDLHGYGYLEAVRRVFGARG